MTQESKPMKHGKLFVSIVASALWAQSAMAQPGPRDPRHEQPAPAHEEADRDHRAEPATPPPMPPVERGHGPVRDWKISHPVVSGYVPARAEAGTKVVIRGQNFAAGTQLVWGNAPVAEATVTPTQIEFTVPAGHPPGQIVLRGGGLNRDLPVGSFEAAKINEEEEKKIEEDRQHHAEEAWNERAKSFGKERAERDAAVAAQENALERNREERRTKYIADERSHFHAEFLADPATQAELTLHAERLARLERMSRLAEQVDDSKIGIRVEVATTRENDRHNQRMAALQAAFGNK